MTTDPIWRTSTYTKSDSCVEVADNAPQRVMVRDTKDREGGLLTLLPATWKTFVEFSKDLPV
ncbi:DUF397 domain-containing protein [Streptomyces anulatus]|uniref:DUF397 domain-containing protein n=1 Tax=Streptomyces anulatus TaxID=1892 RepID=UPI00386CDACD